MTPKTGRRKFRRNQATVWAMTVLVSLVILFPVVWIFSSSITDKQSLFSVPVTYFPHKPTLENYQVLFAAINLKLMAGNTLWIAAISIVATILISYFAAYAFDRVAFRGRHTLYSLLTFSAMLPMIITLVPLSRMMQMFKLTDTVIGLSILYTSSFIPFTTMIFTNSIHDVPVALEEAAEVDGASVWRRLFGIILPLLRPVVATMAIIIFIWSLNEFITPLIFSGQNAMPLSVGLSLVPRDNQYAVPWEKISAMATLIMIPIVLFVTIFQRQIMDGLMAGGVKQ